MKLRHFLFLFSSLTAVSVSAKPSGKKTVPQAPEPQGTPEVMYQDNGEYRYDNYEILGLPWLPDKGLVLMGMERLKAKEVSGREDAGWAFETNEHYDTRRALPYPLNGPCITLKLQSDYKVTDENSDPAKFTWTKDAGSSGVWDVDAALRADLWLPAMYSPTGAEASLAFGYEIHRSGASSSKVDLQSYHLSIPFVDKVIFGRIPFLETSDQVFQLDVSYNRDGVSGKDGFDVETDYRPTFKIPLGKYGLWFGTRCSMQDGMEPLDPSRVPAGFYYLLEPKIGLSYGDRFSFGSPTANLDDELVSSYQLKAMVGKRLGRSTGAMVAEVSYTFKGGNSLTGGDSFSYHEAALHLKPSSKTNPVSFDVTYQKGASGFKQADIDRLTIGFGVGF